ncbi:MAG: ThiF family adenylyltransferase [Opitutales bacterium]
MSPGGGLNEHERSLYSRQIRLPGVGESGQLRLKAAKVLIVGAGGLGSPAALYLAAAGVGTIGVADPDKVELTNLHRQILHGFDTLGLPKTVSAAEALSELNPGLILPLHPDGLTAGNAMDLVPRYDLVLDGADNFATRFLASDAAVLAGRPLVHGSVLRSEGQVISLVPGAGCYRCLYPVMPDASQVPTCSEAGVLGAVCGIVGSWMASEAVSLLLGARKASRVLQIDAERGLCRPLALQRDDRCPCCGNTPSIRSISPETYRPVCASPPSSMPDHPLEISVKEAAAALAAPTPPVLIDVREPDEHAICRIPGARLIPMGQVPARLAEIPRDAVVLVHCHHGGRSLRVTQFLRAKGFASVSNVKGGIDAWSREIDAAVPRY